MHGAWPEWLISDFFCCCSVWFPVDRHCRRTNLATWTQAMAAAMATIATPIVIPAHRTAGAIRAMGHRHRWAKHLATCNRSLATIHGARWNRHSHQTPAAGAVRWIIRRSATIARTTNDRANHRRRRIWTHRVWATAPADQTHFWAVNGHRIAMAAIICRHDSIMDASKNRAHASSVWQIYSHNKNKIQRQIFFNHIQ